MSSIELKVTARERDLGGFQVRRLLPYATHRMVGPFIFFDHMGPALFPPGKGLEVRPHPHIGLATVTYLFEGAIHHRDSLGSDQWIQPGDINWMTAGHGIVHSERTPEELIPVETRMNGIQLWVALPEEHEEIAPSFVHHPKSTLPEFAVKDVKIKLLLGRAFDHASPVKVHSDLFYLQTIIPAGSKFTLPLVGAQEVAFYLVSGDVRCSNEEIQHSTMVIAKSGQTLEVEALTEAKLLWLGGSSVGERFIFWNFVASSEQKLESAKAAWANGPESKTRFPPIPTDHKDFIPLPEAPKKGTIL
jgi:redox-sensitive bicupin YhaK (pirin superfamily)